MTQAGNDKGEVEIKAENTAFLVQSHVLAEARHELRQPLAALSIYANMLKPHVANTGLPMLTQIDACIANLNQLITTLLLSCQQDALVHHRHTDTEQPDTDNSPGIPDP